MRRKNPAAVELGRRGGQKGGRARAAKLTPQERSLSARQAVLVRWAKNRVRQELVANRGLFPEFGALPSFEIADKGASIEAGRGRTYQIYCQDCFEWMSSRSSRSIHAIVTDPPYGLVEFTDIEKGKLRNGRGGVWRIPPSFDGTTRSPLPRFTVLKPSDLIALQDFFTKWGRLAESVLVPGGHVFVATNPLLSDLISTSLRSAGLEKRGEVIRLVQTLRGGDRPKNAHTEFSDVTVMPRSCFEPWVVFRKPCEGRVQDNLRRWGTGGLRRHSLERPFTDVIPSSPTRLEERDLAPHPALKPQAFMRELVWAALPLGTGLLLDPFMGAGSTIAAAEAVGYRSIGIENDSEYFKTAEKAIPKLVAIKPQLVLGRFSQGSR